MRISHTHLCAYPTHTYAHTPHTLMRIHHTHLCAYPTHTYVHIPHTLMCISHTHLCTYPIYTYAYITTCDMHKFSLPHLKLLFLIIFREKYGKRLPSLQGFCSSCTYLSISLEEFFGEMNENGWGRRSPLFFEGLEKICRPLRIALKFFPVFFFEFLLTHFSFKCILYLLCFYL